MTKKFEIEIESTTYRTYTIEADSASEAQEEAFAQLDEDYMISTAWKEGAKVSSCNPLDGTSNMDNDEFGKYIKGE